MKKFLFLSLLCCSSVQALPFNGNFTSRAPVLTSDNSPLRVNAYQQATALTDKAQSNGHVLLGAYTDFGYSFTVARHLYFAGSVFAQLNEGTRERLTGFSDKGYQQHGSFTVKRSNFYTGLQFSSGFVFPGNNLVYFTYGAARVNTKLALPSTTLGTTNLPAENVRKNITVAQYGLTYSHSISSFGQLFVRANHIYHAPFAVSRSANNRSERYTVNTNLWQFVAGVRKYF